MTDVLKGSMAGVLATLPMSAVQVVTSTTGLLGEQPPRTIFRRLLRRTGDRRPEKHEKLTSLLSLGAHFGYGAVAGGLFAFGKRKLPGGLHTAWQGAAYGLAIWALGYVGWIPALGILPPPDRDQPGRAVTMLTAHLVYGAAVSSVLERLARGEDRRSDAGNVSGHPA